MASPAQAELWLHLSGDPLLLHSIENGQLISHRLEQDGQRLAYQVPANTWMAAESLGSYSLVSCFLAPAFSTMELAGRDELISQFPNIADLPELFHE